jgi:hypothetical protein
MRSIEINKACDLWFVVKGSWLMVRGGGRRWLRYDV